MCAQCGAAFQGGPSARWCPACRLERRRARDREYKRSGPARKLGSVQICERCGGEYILDAGLQRYCPGCAEEAVRENRLPKKRIAQRAYDPDHAKRNANKVGIRLCVICGAPILGDRAQLPVVTCSEGCNRIRKQRLQAEADGKRGE